MDDPEQTRPFVVDSMTVPKTLKLAEPAFEIAVVINLNELLKTVTNDELPVTVKPVLAAVLPEKGPKKTEFFNSNLALLTEIAVVLPRLCKLLAITIGVPLLLILRPVENLNIVTDSNL